MSPATRFLAQDVPILLGIITPNPGAVVPKSLSLLLAGLALHAPELLFVGIAIVVLAATPPVLAPMVRRWDCLASLWRRVELACPNAGCYKPYRLPIYICPTCSAEHADLEPSSLGVFKRPCKCGAVLPTRGEARDALPSLCPECRKPLKVVREHTMRIPLVAGPSAGKTSYLMGLMGELASQSKRGRLGLAFPKRKYETLFEECHSALESGTPPKKTPELSPDAFVVKLKDLVGNVGTLHLFDAAGELFERTDHLRNQEYLGRSQGFALVIDPFSLPGVRSNKGDSIASASDRLRPSEVPPQETYDRLTATLREKGKLGGARCDLPVAVIVTKADALGLMKELRGDEAGEWVPASSQAVAAWLEKNGEGNLVRSLRRDFRRVRYFAVSALGRLPDDSGQPFVPRFVVHPMAWLLAHGGLQLTEAVEAEARQANRMVWLARAGAVAACIAGMYTFDAGLFRALSPGLLRETAQAGLAANVSNLLDNGADKDARNKAGETALFLATANQRNLAARVLLAHKADANLSNAQGETPLILAAREGDQSLLDGLLTAGARVNAKSPANESALSAAIAAGNAQCAEMLLDSGADPDTLQPDGVPVLVGAYQKDLPAVMQALLATGAKPDVSDEHGQPVLQLAVKDKRRADLQLLLAHGAKPDLADGAGGRALFIALANDDPETIGMLLAKGADPDAPQNGERPIFLAVAHRDTGAIKALLAANADGGCRDQDGNTPLHRAVLDKQEPVVEALLQGHAPTELRDKQGDTPLLLAVRQGNTEAAITLAQAGASLAAQDSSGKTPWILAADTDQLDLLDGLVKQRAPLDLQDAQGRSALLAIVEASPPASADNSAPTPDPGEADNQKALLVKLLLGRGASVDLPDAGHVTPLIAAAEAEEPRTAKILLGAHADLLAVAADGNSAVRWAAARHDDELVNLFGGYFRSQAVAQADAVDQANAKLIQVANASGKQMDPQNYRVTLGGFTSEGSADRALDHLRQAGFNGQLKEGDGAYRIVVEKTTERDTAIERTVLLGFAGFAAKIR